ncbi:MAG: response regulator [Gemmatimonadota bacterium]|nr:response regulator [Gemmatimonadota bacterium]
MKRPAKVKGRLLIVDDEADVLKALTELFKQEGYEIRTAESAYQSALGIGGSWVPDLIVLDWKLSPAMTGHDGQDLLSHFWEDCKHRIPVIVFSGYAGNPEFDAAKKNLETECDRLIYDCIPKPGCKELIKAVRRYFEEQKKAVPVQDA